MRQQLLTRSRVEKTKIKEITDRSSTLNNEKTLVV